MVAAVALSTSACTTMSIPTGGPCIEGDAVIAPLNLGGVSSQRYNQTCGQTMAGNTMLKANDPGLNAVGILTLEAANPAMRKSGDRVRDALANQGEQNYTVVRSPNGTVRLVGAPVVTVPRRETETTAPATPPPAAAPAASAPAPQM